MATDFLSQAAFDDETVTLPTDALDHGRRARRVLDFARQLAPGSVIAVQGSWGRGKTDVLARIALATYAESPPPGVADRAIWINPWQYGTPDLLTPVVTALRDRAEGLGLGDAVKKHASTLIAAGTSFGMKAAGTAAGPAGALLTLAAPEAARLAGTISLQGDVGDPVAEMARSFRELVVAALPPESRGVGGRQLILVDDLDRCLPGRQVALLQALRFLTASGAPATFVVALDPALAKQGVRAHYRSDAFDADQYLDKMFDLRLDLPALGATGLRSLCSLLARRPVETVSGEAVLGIDRVHGDVAFPVPELRNPRLIGRVFEKLRFVAAAGGLPDGGVDTLLLWTAVGERWPEVRRVTRNVGINGLRRYLAGEELGDAFARQIQGSPSLRAVFEQLSEDVDTVVRAERALQEVGL
ncbi:MAG: hypothetical protein GY884_28650 [Proteobacteria bacterium]|nr:hypothetical protein [Pseudomonadota bacterium]